jgi:hypothetical protein
MVMSVKLVWIRDVLEALIGASPPVESGGTVSLVEDGTRGGATTAIAAVNRFLRHPPTLICALRNSY